MADFTITPDEYNAARAITDAYEKAMAEAAAAARAAYATGLQVMFKSDRFVAFNVDLNTLIANQKDDGLYSMQVHSLRTILDNLAIQVGSPLDNSVPAPAAEPETTPTTEQISSTPEATTTTTDPEADTSQPS